MLLAGGAACVSAQVKFGVVGGWSTHNKMLFERRNAFTTQTRYGWYFGPKMWVKIPVTGLSANVALEYSQRNFHCGAKYEGKIGMASKKYCSLEIPANLRLGFSPARKTNVYLETGPQVAITVGSRKAANIMEFNPVNLSWSMGAGVRLFNHIEVGGLYNFAPVSFGTIYNPRQPETSKRAKSGMMPRSWNITMGYVF